MLLARYFADKYLKLTRLQFKISKNYFNGCLKKKKSLHVLVFNNVSFDSL